MSNKPDGGPAFPTLKRLEGTSAGVQTAVSSQGMTLRDYFATKALPVVAPGYERAGKDFIASSDFDSLAQGAYELADAMLKARES